MARLERLIWLVLALMGANIALHLLNWYGQQMGCLL